MSPQSDYHDHGPLPLQAFEVAELRSRVRFWERVVVWTLELAGLCALGLGVLAMCALRTG